MKKGKPEILSNTKLSSRQREFLPYPRINGLEGRTLSIRKIFFI